MIDILNKIVAYKKEEVKQKQAVTSIKDLEGTDSFSRKCNSYLAQLETLDRFTGVISEFKRKSPSKSNINLDADLLDVTSAYHGCGASAISILTDTEFFGGQDNYLVEVRKHLPRAVILRKEFIISEYQIIEAKALGADMILLICEILTEEEVKKFATLARSLGMEVLLEMHDAKQIEKYDASVSVVGINNRDLRTFEVDYERSKKLFDILPEDVIKIAESGLSDTTTCAMLYEHGFRGFLIGENFMRASDPGKECRDFIDDLRNKIKAL